jgi:DNA gyrase subunit A
MLRDLEKNTVDFSPNFDDTLREPSVLPAQVPNLLVNGSSGIAVGMATNIPPHNLREIVEACCRVIENPDLTIEELTGIVKGPDFPTGGIILGRRGIREVYATGRGHIRVRARVIGETTKAGREALIITELPYQVNKARLIETIAELVRHKKIQDIVDLRDESDREGMRVVIELKRDALPDLVLNQLFKHTEMERTFASNFLALVNSRPAELNLLQCINHYLEHRHDVISRRIIFDLKRAEARAHIVEGLLKAQDAIDEVIRVIRESKDNDSARPALMERFGFTEVQAQAILDMRLRRLTGLERVELETEWAELQERIGELRLLSGDRTLRMGVVSRELRMVAEEYGEDRRTEITSVAPGEFEAEDLIPDDQMVVTVSREGYIKRLSPDTYRSQRRGGKGITGARPREEDSVDQIFVSSNHSYILFFTNLGRCYWLKVYQIPEGGRTGKGKAIVNLIDLRPDERPVAHVTVKDFDEDRFIMMATSNGLVKKTPLHNYGRPRRSGIWAIALDEGAELVGAALTSGSSQVVLALGRGKANLFPETEVRATGRNTRGVRGIRVGSDDRLVGMVILDEPGSLLTITGHGYGKRTPSEEYRITHRGSGGIINIRNIGRNGPVIAVMKVDPENELIMVSSHGMIIRLTVKDVRETSRNTMGVKLMNLPEDDRLVDAAVVPEESGDGPGEEEGFPGEEEEYVDSDGTGEES